MAGALTVSTTASPFPYAAVITATFTKQAEITFDESASGVSLELNGATITTEDEVVRALAKEAGLADDSAKVRDALDLQSGLINFCIYRLSRSLSSPKSSRRLPHSLNS